MVMVKKKLQGYVFPQGGTPFSEVNKFLDECRAFENPSRLGVYLVTRYKDLFGGEPPNTMLCLIKAKIAYRLQYIGFKNAHKEMSEKFLKNYEAAQKLDADGFVGDSSFFMEMSVKQERQQQGEGTMAKVKKKASKLEKAAKPEKVAKEKKLRPGAAFVQLFSENSKKKLTDKAIAAEVARLCPDAKKYTEAEVGGYRNGFNNGKLSGQTGKPKVASVKYEK